MKKRDLIDFSVFCGMYHDGGSAIVKIGERTHRVTGKGHPRKFTLDGKPIDASELRCLTIHSNFVGLTQGTEQ